MKSGLWIVVPAVLVGVIGGLSLWQHERLAGLGGASGVAIESQRQERRAIAVETAAVETGAIRARLIFSGSLTPAAQFDIAARIAGRLEELKVDIGDAVEPGQLIGRLDDEESVQQLAQAQAELAVARASLAEAEAALEASTRSLRRTRELREQRVASQSELEAAETEVQAQKARVDLARSQISQRQAAVRAAEVRLSYTSLRATWNGGGESRVVAERYADEGTLLQANSPVLSLVSLDPLRGVIFAVERDYARLRVGQPVIITSDALPGRSFDGEISRLAPVFREASRQARVEVHIPNPDGTLKPGMFIQARVQVDTRDDATLVPLDAVVERNDTRGLFRVRETDDGAIAEFVTVETGLEEDGMVEVLGPALSGRVITVGQHQLSDGIAIRLAGEGPENGG